MRGFVIDSKEKYVNPYKKDYNKNLDKVPEYMREKNKIRKYCKI